MSEKNPAAPMLRRAAQLLRQEARTLERSYSLGGAGKIWPRAHRREQERRNELRHLALNLKNLSAAFGRFTLNRRRAAKPILEELDG